MQAFDFRTADDANEFMAGARSATGCASTPAPLIDFALARLPLSTRRVGYEKPLTFRIEGATASEGRLTVDGWVALWPEELAGFRAWRPERAEFLDLTRAWSRSSRADIVERFPALASKEGDHFGFRAVVEFSRAFPPMPDEKVLFGVARRGGSEEWIELAVGQDVSPA
jgi:hypothetical protein